MTENNAFVNFEELLELFEGRQYAALMNQLDELNPVDAADFLSHLPSDKLPLIFRMLKKDPASAIFAELDADLQESLISAMSDREITDMLEELYTDDVVDMLEEMPAGMVKRIMKNATPETRAEINRFLSYPEDSAGSIMTSEYIDLKKEMTCEAAIARIRKIGLDKETVYVAYVTDHSRILEGVVPLKRLLFAEPEDRIADIMEENVIFAYTHDDRETVANTISRYGLLALPITDKERRLVGLVTVDDALEVLEDEATEDIEKMAAILPTDKPYMKTGVWETWKKRTPWLLLLMLTATFTSTIITHYEAAIGTYAILTAFVPMLMNTGGNAGSQSSVTVVRGLSLGEIEMRDVFRVLFKEFAVSVLSGITLAAATFLKVMAIDFRFQGTTVLASGAVQNNLTIALVISITVFFGIVIAKIVGALLPIATKRLGLDPAVMASPFITTIVDTVTLVIYFTVATVILHL
ncbi:MAG: magnesium transporter [Clostridia bacterium]|nr:magnesium transporter [Clostridia bacterium]